MNRSEVEARDIKKERSKQAKDRSKKNEEEKKKRQTNRQRDRRTESLI